MSLITIHGPAPGRSFIQTRAIETDFVPRVGDKINIEGYEYTVRKVDYVLNRDDDLKPRVYYS